jgi:hypothetical protein
VQVIGISGAIPAFVVTTDESDHLSQVHQRRQDLGTDSDMLLHVLELLFRQRPLFVQDLFPNADLADVV